MSGSTGGEGGGFAHAAVRRRRRFSWIWLVPIVAVAITIYLGIREIAERGPLITITFQTANGITAGQTEVRHKAVALGQVEGVRLSEDLRRVVVHVRMNRQGERLLTDHAHFWVVRPRLTPGNISGLETLVSGAYIEVDPGDPGGQEAYKFEGLEDPPAVRSDEPGRTFTLDARRLGSIGPGTPVFYRDLTVGEVLGYDIGDGLGPIAVRVFVRAPFDRFVKPSSHFWNTSGITVGFGPSGLHVELASLQAILSGGISFETLRAMAAQPPAPSRSRFPLYETKSAADEAGYTRSIPFVAYFQSSVAGLGRGSPVEVFGIQIGTVTDVRLLMDRGGESMRARVAFNLQPERVFSEEEILQQKDPEVISSALVGQGMRAVLESSSFITGQKAIAFEYVPNAPPAAVGREGDALVIPSQGGGLDNITSALSTVANKLQTIPFDEIGRNLNDALRAVSRTVNGVDLQNALHDLAASLADVRQIVRRANSRLGPALDRLPQVARDLQEAAARANAALGEGGYGGNSDFQRGVARVLDQVNDAARSIRLLADFLDRHPEALIRGRTAQAAER